MKGNFAWIDYQFQGHPIMKGNFAWIEYNLCELLETDFNYDSSGHYPSFIWNTKFRRRCSVPSSGVAYSVGPGPETETCLALVESHFSRGKSPWYPLNKSLGGPQNRSARYGDVKILEPIGTRTPTPRSSSPSPVAIPTQHILHICWSAAKTFEGQYLRVYRNTDRSQ
jgi:hypothetical protein